MKKMFVLFVLFASLTSTQGQGLDSGWLNFATNFNALVFGNFTAASGSSEYRLASRGETSFSGGYSVGMPVTGLPLPTYTNAMTDILISGADLHDGSFGINGNIIYAGTRSGPTRYMTDGNIVEQVTNITFTASGNVSRNGTGYTWEQLFEQACITSETLASFENQGVTIIDFSNRYQRFLTGTNEWLNVFNVTATNWNMTSSQVVIEAPSNSVVLINIQGGPVAITNSGIELVGVDQTHLIYNYADAAQITTKSFLHPGSVLAPFASALLSGGAVNGTAVFGGNVTVTTGFSFNNFPYTGGTLGTSSTPVNEAPIVDAGLDFVLESFDPVALAGRVADDGLPAGATLTTRWQAMGDNAAAVEFNDATLTNAMVTFSDEGEYVLGLFATDTQAEAQDTVKVVVRMPNEAPVVDAGADFDIVAGTPKELGGVVVDDGKPLDGVLATQWSVVTGDISAVEFENRFMSATSARFTQVGIYVLQLSASDGVLASSDTVAVTVVPARSPLLTVDAGQDRIIAWTNRTARLDGQVGAEGFSVGTLVSTEWSLVSGPTNEIVFHFEKAVGELPSDGPWVPHAAFATFYAPGQYVLRLTADGGTTQAVDEVTLTFIPPDDRPIVALAQTVVTKENKEVLFDLMGWTDSLYRSEPVYFSGGDGVEHEGIRSAQVTQCEFVYGRPPQHGTLEFLGESEYRELFSDMVYINKYFMSSRDLVECSYRPEAGFIGLDSFTFWVLEKDHFSEATVWVQVLPDNDSPPSPEKRTTSLETDQGRPASLYLDATNGDQTPLSFAVVTPPVHGIVNLAPQSDTDQSVVAVYTPEPNYSGSDTFVIQAVSGQTVMFEDAVTVRILPMTFSVDAGSDRSLSAPCTLALSGSVHMISPVPEAPTNIVWSRRHGPGEVVFSDSSDLATSASFSIPGTYVLELAAEHGGVRRSDALKIVVASADMETQSFPRFSSGTDFWLTKAGNANPHFLGDPRPGLCDGRSELIITSEVDTEGMVTFDVTDMTFDWSGGAGWSTPVTVTRYSKPFSVRAGVPTYVSIDGADGFSHDYEFHMIYQQVSDVVTRSAIHVTANDPIAVVELETTGVLSDGYQALPTSMLGTNYFVMSYRNTPQDGPDAATGGTGFAVVAPLDDTHVQILPTVTAGERFVGVPFEITLQSGEVYRLVNEDDSAADFSGTQISSDKPVAVFGGNKATRVTSLDLSLGQLATQLTPTAMWGRHFMTLPMTEASDEDTFRFLASQEGTEITVNGVHKVTLDCGQFYDCVLDGSAEIVSSHPILTAQFATSEQFDFGGGQPSMALVPAVEQYGTSYVFGTPQDDLPGAILGSVFQNVINVVIPSSVLASFMLDGEPVASSLFFPIANSGYFGARIPIAAGSHRLEASAPFCATVHGWRMDEMYAYPAGLHFEPTYPSCELELLQTTPYAIVNSEKAVVARVTDAQGNPVPDIRVQFTVEGVHSAHGWGWTGQNGEASFAYYGESTGVDVIRASLGTVQSEVTHAWIQAGANQTPTLSVPPLQYTRPKTWLMVTGAVDDDGQPLGAELETTWRVLSGPRLVRFSTVAPASFVGYFEFPGTYVLEATANDGELCARDLATVVVQEDWEVSLHATTEAWNSDELEPGSAVVFGQSGWLTAEIRGNAGWIARVEFFDGDRKIGEIVPAIGSSDIFSESRSFGSVEWVVPPDVGRRSLTALVTDGEGAQKRSAPLEYDVRQIKIALRQDTAMAQVGAKKRVVATLVDETGAPFGKGAPWPLENYIFFAVDGANGSEYGWWSEINEWGEADFEYAGTISGVDEIWAEYTPYYEFDGGEVYFLDVLTNLWITSDDNQTPRIQFEDSQTASPTIPFQPAVVVTDDGLPTGELSTYWRVVSGPAQPVFTDSSSPETFIVFPVISRDPWSIEDYEGSYVLELTVSDTQFSTNASFMVYVDAPPTITYFEMCPDDDGQLLFYVGFSDEECSLIKAELFEGDQLIQTEYGEGNCTFSVEPNRKGKLAYTVRLTDEQGNEVVSNPIFVTLGDPPTLAWTKPPATDLVFAGYPVNLTVATEDADGFVTNVLYYLKDGAISLPIGQGVGPDFSCSWTPAEAKAYTLIAIATDNDGLSSACIPHVVSVIPSQLTGMIESPSEGAIVDVDGIREIRLTINDPQGIFASTEFFANGVGLGVAQASSVNWIPQQIGDYVITAKISDVYGNVRDAENSVVVHVVPGRKPVIEWLAPLEPDPVFTNHPVQLSVSASLPDGSVTNVSYYLKVGADIVPLGQGAGAGFMLSWTPSAVGAYTLVAIATGDNGVDSDPAEHSVIVEAPWVKGTLVAPQDGATALVQRPRSLRLAINDPVRFFASAEFFANGVGLGVVQALTLDWTPQQIGDYVITAKITDVNGVVRNVENSATIHVVDRPRPTVTLLSPKPGSRLRTGIETRILARLKDPGALTTNLLFFANEACIGQYGTYADWTPMDLGSNTLYCVALTSDGQNATSAVVTVEVAQMHPPTVALLCPTNTQRFAVGTIPYLCAETADQDGTSPDLRLLLDGAALAEDAVAFLEVTVTNATPGWHAAFAQATDADGLSISSPVANFFVERAQNSALPIPEGLSAKALSASEIELSWQAVSTNSSVQGILVERWNATQSLWDEIVRISCLQTNYLNSGLMSETAYRYRLAYVDAEGRRSAYSTEAAASTPVVFRRYSAFDLTSAVEGLTRDPASQERGLSSSAQTHYDVRRTGPLGSRHAEVVLGSQAAVLRQAVARFTETWPQVRLDFDPILLSPQSILPTVGFLTGPGGSGVTVSDATAQLFDPADPNTPVKAFLEEHRDLFGFGPEALDEADVYRDSESPLTGARTCVWRQQVEGVPVFNALFIGHVTSNAELAAVSCSFIPSPSEAAPLGMAHAAAFGQALPVNARQALLAALQNVGEAINVADIISQGSANGVNRVQRFAAARGVKGEAHTELVWFPVSRHELKLAWQTIFTSQWRDEMYLTLVSAQDGLILYRRNLTVAGESAAYRVYTGNSPAPSLPGPSAPTTAQPGFDVRSLVTLEALDIVASPAGWIDDGDNETRGNNVAAHLDRDDDDIPDLPSPVGTPPRTFDFQIPFAAGPVSYGAAAVVQVFFWNNWAHDVLYGLGFTEATGNFQDENFGYGGFESDAVQADVQNGLYRTGGRYRNTANISVPPDGHAPRMQLSVFDGPNPDRDSGLDADLILHEYIHGLSIRTLGGGVGIDALQTAGIGEGWSDFYALALMAPPDADIDAAYPFGTYVAHCAFGTDFNQNSYYGLRRYPYSTDTNKNPLAFADIDPAQASPYADVPRNPLSGPFRAEEAQEVHRQGEVWCALLWEMRANLIQKYGHETGNTLALALATEGMRLSPQNPTYVQARDAILLADRMLSDGLDAPEIWAAFVKRGLGHEAEAPYSYTTSGIRASEEAPPILVAERVDVLDGDGPIGADEESTLRVTLRNQGATGITGVSARLSTATPGVEVLQADVLYGAMAAGQSNAGTATFRLATGSGFVEGSSIELSLAIVSDQISAGGTLLLNKDRSGPGLPSTPDALLNTSVVSAQAATTDFTPYDIGDLEPLWMADDASCLLKAATGKYVLWRPYDTPVALTDPTFLAHRLTRHGVVVGEQTAQRTTDSYGNVLEHTLGVAWTPGESAPRSLTTGSYIYPKGATVGEIVGLAYDLTDQDENGNPAYLGGVRIHPSLQSVWDINKPGLAVGIASVYMRPTDVDNNGRIGTNEVSSAPIEWSQFKADGTMEWMRSTERALSAMNSGSPAQGVYYNALLMSAVRFGPGLDWSWLGPLGNDGISAVSLATLINDNGEVAGMGVDAQGVNRVFRWKESDGEFTLSYPFGIPRVRLLDPEGVDAFPSAMNQAGDIVGNLDAGGSCAVFWRAGETVAQELGTFGAVPGASQGISTAYALNDSQQVVGTALKNDPLSGAAVSVGTLWQRNASTGGASGWAIADLNDRLVDPDWCVLNAVGINPDGWILARAQHALRDEQGVLVGSESCAVLLLSGDLDIDSDNNGGLFGALDRLEVEDRLEDDESLPGRILAVNDGDSDGDGLPGFADGYGQDAKDVNSLDSLGDRFADMVLELPRGIDLAVAQLEFVYSASDPQGVTCSADVPPVFEPAPGELRIWTKSAHTRRSGKSVSDTAGPGDFVPSGVAASASALGFAEPTDGSAPVLTFHVEAVRPSAAVGGGRILVRLDLDGPGPLGWTDLDAVRTTAWNFALVPDFDRDGVIDEKDHRLVVVKGIFRFWINDDRDFGFWGTQALEDGPEGSCEESSWLNWFWAVIQFWNNKFSERDRNAKDETVNGVRDLVDFFPLRVDMPPRSFPLALTYRLSQYGGGAVNFAYTSLDPATVGDLQTTECASGFGSDRTQPAESATILQVTDAGIDIDGAWLNGRTEDQKSVVLMCEGRAVSTQPLILEVLHNGVIVCTVSLDLSLSSVKDMFRYLNVREGDVYFTQDSKRPATAGLWPSRLDEPLNLPDAYLLEDGAKQKTLVMVHGLDWDEAETPAGHSEIFKRLYQAGSNARYIGVSWSSDLSRRIPGPIVYANDVIGAFIAAPLVKTGLSGFLGPDTTVVAHSLGNVLVSSAIQDQDMSVGKYVMLNPAVPTEAYDGRAEPSDPDRRNMTHPDWLGTASNGSQDYPERVMAAGWSTLFSAGDPRSKVTWDNRFGGVLSATEVWQFYSTGEEILRKAEPGMPSVVGWEDAANAGISKFNWLSPIDLTPVNSQTLAGGQEWVWVYHEQSKGVLPLVLASQIPFLDTKIPRHRSAGWAFNPDWFYNKLVGFDEIGPVYKSVPKDPSMTSGLSTPQLIANPFFKPFDTDEHAAIPLWTFVNNWLYLPDGDIEVNNRLPQPQFSDIGMAKLRNHAKLLAEMIPPLSSPAGGMEIKALVKPTVNRAVNMNAAIFKNETLWPDTRPGKSERQQLDRRWLHGDYKDAPYRLTHKLYEKITEISQKKQP